MTNGVVRVTDTQIDAIVQATSRRERALMLYDLQDRQDAANAHTLEVVTGRLHTVTELAEISQTDERYKWKRKGRFFSAQDMNTALCWAKLQRRTPNGYELLEFTEEGVVMVYGRAHFSGKQSSVRWHVDVLDVLARKARTYRTVGGA